jgi:glycine cleavage system aminomethyltransferase T
VSKVVVAEDRGEEGEMTRQPVMRSAAHRAHKELGARFERRAAWEVPVTYTSVGDEAGPLQSTLGFADISARGKVHLSGAIDPMIRRLTRSTLEPQRTAAAGSGATVARLARDWALVLASASGEGGVMSALEPEPTTDAMATDVTSAMSGFLVAGPRIEEFFVRTLTIDPSELTAGRCTGATWARIPAVLVMRDLRAPAVELYVGSDYGRYAWETLGEMCGRLGGSPVGWNALEAWGWA